MSYEERWKKKLLPLVNSIIALTVDQPWPWASRQPEQINETKGNTTSMDRLYLLHCDLSKMRVGLCQFPPENHFILQWSKIQLSIFFPDVYLIYTYIFDIFVYIWYVHIYNIHIYLIHIYLIYKLQQYNVKIHFFKVISHL